jgi:class 3 adenylate cyclase
MKGVEGEPLTCAQLAIEGEVDEAYIERLVEIGVLHPTDAIFGWADLWRVRTMRALEDAGMSLERMAPLFQSGRLNLAFLDNMLPLAPRTGRSFAQFAASLGEHAALAGTAYEMLGLAHPPDDMQTRTDEEEAVREMIELWADDPEIMKRAARVAGYAIRLIVEGWTGLHLELYRNLGGGGREQWSPELLARESVNSGRAIRLAEKIPRWLTLRHYEQVLYADIIENIEMQIDPFEERRTDLPGVRQPAIVFIDLSGFTAMTEAEGDHAASAATARFEEAVSLASLRQGGRGVKLLGDGALLHFPEALPAVRATLEIRDDLADLPLRPHAGIDCGPIAERDGDVFGRTVNMASRLASAATEGQVLVSSPVAQAAQTAGLGIDELGPLHLKGVEQPVPVFLIGDRESDRG